ncbi:bifunctional protein-serine/threonine kinase/phosphatase [Sinobacterium caligoides]|nr:bifunctional protein-serine/threonine kinase/phosphatase [Sinobacterium caligoides]
MHLDGQLSLSAAQQSAAGVKPQNEDSIGICIPADVSLTTKGAVIAIADGVSAAEAGKEASETCIRNFLGDYYATPESWSVKKSAQQVLIALNRWLYGQGQRFIRAERGYVSTLSVLVLKSRVAHIFHVGDSRVYRVRGGDIEQITRDHATRITPEQSYLTRAMGLDIRLEVDYMHHDIEEGDVYILTTDGIHDVLRDRELLAAAQAPTEEYEARCAELIRLALELGSTDNLSCQIVRVDALPKGDANDMYVRLTDLPFPPFLSPGMILDGYRIEREIHASNKSQLYIVTDVETDTRYCMKTPSVNFEDDTAYIERFIMESWIGTRIDNPHVVKVVKRDAPKTCLYYLTEYVEGRTVGQWIKDQQGDARVDEVREIVRSLIRGVRAIHRKDTLHQDLKPDNVLLDADGGVKIVDFGSCLVAGIAEIAVPIQREAALGTLHYSAPEYTLNRKPSALSDQFAVAVICYEMLAGVQPYEGKLANCTALKQFMALEYVPCFHYNPLVPVWLDGALKRALSISPELRYQDLSEFEYDLFNPNPKYMKQVSTAWIERNPLRFWQATAGVLACLQLATLYFWLG